MAAPVEYAQVRTLPPAVCGARGVRRQAPNTQEDSQIYSIIEKAPAQGDNIRDLPVPVLPADPLHNEVLQEHDEGRLRVASKQKSKAGSFL